MKRRVINLLLTASLCTSVLCGCSAQTAQNTENSTECTEIEYTSEPGVITYTTAYDEPTIEDYVKLEVWSYHVTNRGLFKGTTLYNCMPDGSIHVYDEEWISASYITDVWVNTHSTNDYTEWEVIAPSDIL